MTTLFLRLTGDDASIPSAWWLCDEGEVLQSGLDALNAIEAELDEAVVGLDKLQTVAVIPDNDVLHLHVEVPGRSSSRIRQAAPFAVEPFLSEELEEVHVAIGEVKRGESVPCLAINRTRFEAYRQLFENTTLQPRLMTTMASLCGDSADLFLVETNELVTVCTQRQCAVVAEQALAATLAASVASTESEFNVQCIGANALAEKTRAALAQAEIDDVSMHLKSIDDFFAAIEEPMQSTNLLQGEFAFKDTASVVKLGWHKTAMAIAASVIIVSCVALAQGFWANLQTAKLNEQSLDIFEGVYGTRNVAGNPVFRMQERMGAHVGSGSKWLNLLEGVVNAAGGVELTNLDFNEVQNEMTMQLNADNYGEFEALRSRIERLGLSISVNVAERTSTGVWARITISSP